MSNLGPGWYDDGSGNKRWWDGQAWTEHAQPAGPIPAERPSRSPMIGLVIAAVAAALAVTLAIVLWVNAQGQDHPAKPMQSAPTSPALPTAANSPSPVTASPTVSSVPAPADIARTSFEASSCGALRQTYTASEWAYAFRRSACRDADVRKASSHVHDIRAIRSQTQGDNALVELNYTAAPASHKNAVVYLVKVNGHWLVETIGASSALKSLEVLGSSPGTPEDVVHQYVAAGTCAAYRATVTVGFWATYGRCRDADVASRTVHASTATFTGIQTSGTSSVVKVQLTRASGSGSATVYLLKVDGQWKISAWIST